MQNNQECNLISPDPHIQFVESVIHGSGEISSSDGNAITLKIYLCGLDEPIFYTCSLKDKSSKMSEELFRQAKAGKFGPLGRNVWEEQVSEYLKQMEPTEQEKMKERQEQCRNERNRRLEESDKYMLVDFPISIEEKEMWMDYRRQLRELDFSNPESILWPTKPEKNTKIHSTQNLP